MDDKELVTASGESVYDAQESNMEDPGRAKA